MKSPPPDIMCPGCDRPYRIECKVDHEPCKWDCPNSYYLTPLGVFPCLCYGHAECVEAGRHACEHGLKMVESVQSFMRDRSAPEPVDLSDEALESMRRRAMRATTGFATQEDQLYLDEVLAVISELIRLRQGLQPVLDNKHLVLCAQQNGEPCACHYWMVHELMEQVD